ncbi:MAG: hypothetical protein P4L52_07065 [Acidocella sp.]|nr:hypothetical protein [Acidocella sp.]
MSAALLAGSVPFCLANGQEAAPTPRGGARSPEGRYRSKLPNNFLNQAADLARRQLEGRRFVPHSGVTMLLANGMFCGEVSKIFVFFFEEYILSTHCSIRGPLIKWPYRMKPSAIGEQRFTALWQQSKFEGKKTISAYSAMNVN